MFWFFYNIELVLTWLYDWYYRVAYTTKLAYPAKVADITALSPLHYHVILRYSRHWELSRSVAILWAHNVLCVGASVSVWNRTSSFGSTQLEPWKTSMAPMELATVFLHKTLAIGYKISSFVGLSYVTPWWCYSQKLIGYTYLLKEVENLW